MALPTSLDIYKQSSALLSLAADMAEEKDQAVAKLAEAAPRLLALERLEASEEAITVTQAAKLLGVKRETLTNWLHANSWVYRQNGTWVAYDQHIKNGRLQYKEARGALPSTFMSLAPGSHHPDVWHDVNRMRTLNGDQTNRAVEKHVCPLQFDIVDRLIERYSNPGELVYDPFCGLGTVPYRAILKGRKGGGSELNPGYFMDQVHYLQSAEKQVSMPSLFDALEAEVA